MKLGGWWSGSWSEVMVDGCDQNVLCKCIKNLKNKHKVLILKRTQEHSDQIVT